MNAITDTFENKTWEAFTQFYPSQVAKELGFKNAMLVAYKMLYNEAWQEYMQEYAVTLLFTLRGMYPTDFNSDWKWDAFLGAACDLTLKYEDKYEAYKRAYEKANPPPARLLIAFASCSDCPGVSLLSYDDAITLLKHAIQECPYLDALRALQSVYFSKRDREKQMYWSNMYSKHENEGLRSESIELPFLKQKIWL